MPQQIVVINRDNQSIALHLLSLGLIRDVNREQTISWGFLKLLKRVDAVMGYKNIKRLHLQAPRCRGRQGVHMFAGDTCWS